MENLWPGRVADRTVALFNRWLERHISQGLHSTFITHSESRTLFQRSTERGRSCWKLILLEGYVGIRGTIPPRWTDVDEFGIAFNEEMESFDRMMILAAEDPFDEFHILVDGERVKNREPFKLFLERARVHKESKFDKLLELAMVALQQLLEKRRLVKEMRGEHEIHGWKMISEYLGVHEITALKWARDPEMKLPVSLMGSRPFTTEERLDEWMVKKLNDDPLWKTPERSTQTE